jgi:RNA polymerase sigma-70 factor (ECF subfamily)
MEPSDRELMTRLGRGDRDALAPLMERHHRRIYRVALAYVRNADEALDVVQETFVRAFRHAARWDTASEVVPWLVRIAVNHSIDRYRRGRRRLATEEPLEPGDHDARITADDPSPERRVFGRELSERLAAALRRLPGRQRDVFVLRHYDELSLEEIANALEMSLGTVKSSLHRAIHRLRTELEGLRP